MLSEAHQMIALPSKSIYLETFPSNFLKYTYNLQRLSGFKCVFVHGRYEN